MSPPPPSEAEHQNNLRAIVERVNERAGKLGLHQRHLAEATGLSAASISRWLRGETEKFPLHRAPHLALVLECSLDWLLRPAHDAPVHVIDGSAIEAMRRARSADAPAWAWPWHYSPNTLSRVVFDDEEIAALEQILVAMREGLGRD